MGVNAVTSVPMRSKIKNRSARILTPLPSSFIRGIWAIATRQAMLQMIQETIVIRLSTII
jgi:hypothetical protein